MRPPSRYARAARQPCDIYLWQMGGFAARLRVMYLEPPVLPKRGKDRAFLAKSTKRPNSISHIPYAKNANIILMNKIRAAASNGVAQKLGAAMTYTADLSFGQVVEIDLNRASPPDKSYSADLAGAVYENGVLKLLFGQASRNGKVRSLIEISMSPVSVVQLINSLNKMVNPSIAEILAAMGETNRDLTQFDDDPKEVARLKANMVMVSFYGTETCMHFYDADPFIIKKLKQTGKNSSDSVIGVVRVDTQTALIPTLILKLRELASQFPVQTSRFVEVENGI